jgi:hypothetical protein
LIHVALGDHHAAFQALEQAYRERTPTLLELRVVLGLRALQPNPGFQFLASRMNLP